MKASIEFYGVRGSIASPGASTARVGGNTSCSLVELGGELIIFDGGTGLRRLGAERGAEPMRATILFSHLHWDHIQGVPFFGPLYHPGSRITLVGPAGLKAALEKQMSLPNFPVGMDAMGAKVSFKTIEAGDSFRIGKVRVRTCALNHPGDAIAYRLECGDRSVVHALDHEPGDELADKCLVEFCRAANLLVADAQYTPEESPAKRGWGHGSWASCCQLAKDAQVGTLVLAHHDPTRTDAAVSTIEQRARREHADSWAAREGKNFQLGTREQRQDLHHALESYLATALAAS